MRNMKLIDEQRSLREAPCPRCAADANWSFIDDADTVVEVICPDCGRFELTRAAFEKSESDIVEPNTERE